MESGESVRLLAIIVGAVVVFGLTVALVFRRHDGQPAFVPDPRWLSVAALLAIAGIGLAVSSPVDGSPIPLLVGAALTFAAFLVVGAGLRPRGRRGRGLVLGAVVYVLIGAVSTVLLRATQDYTVVLSIPELLSWVLVWPVLVSHYLAEKTLYFWEKILFF
jgi:hypothetical protein